jgi:hypothetical protein
MVLARKADEVSDFHRRTSEARGTWRGGGTTVAWSRAGERAGRSAGRAARLSRQDEVQGTRGEIA